MADIVERLRSLGRADVEAIDVPLTLHEAAAEITHLREALRKSEERAARLERATNALVTKLDAITDATSWIWGYLAVHGCTYVGPNYSEELTVARAALAKEATDGP